jgi:hypothetical protein
MGRQVIFAGLASLETVKHFLITALEGLGSAIWLEMDSPEPQKSHAVNN